MAGKEISSIDDFQKYLSGVADRANHHARSVAAVVLSLAGAVVLFKDPASEITVFAVKGEMKNVLWVEISSKRYKLSYDHGKQIVQIIEGKTGGKVLNSFSNNSTATEIVDFFRKL